MRDRGFRLLPGLVIPALILMTAGCGSMAGKSSKAENDGYLFFPLPPAKPRVQFLTWASSSADVEPEKSALELFALGEDVAPPRFINKPYGIAARDGVVYICDSKALNLTRLDFKNGSFTVLGTDGPGKLRKPINLIIDPLGYKFVVDSGRKQVVIYDPNDNYVRGYDIPAPSHPVDVAFYENELYVLDNDKTTQIVVLDRSTGKVLRSFGKRGNAPGEFNFPSSLCIDPEGFLYVSDTLNNRIQKLTRKGESVWVRGQPGYHLTQFGRPRGIRAGPDGIIYVVEGAMELVKMYNSDGYVLMYFGGPGSIPGALILPSAIAVDPSSLPYFKKYVHPDFDVKYVLVVASQYGRRLINVYGFGAFPDGYNLSDTKMTVLPRLSADEGSGSTIGPVVNGTVPKTVAPAGSGEKSKTESTSGSSEKREKQDAEKK